MSKPSIVRFNNRVPYRPSSYYHIDVYTFKSEVSLQTFVSSSSILHSQNLVLANILMLVSWFHFHVLGSSKLFSEYFLCYIFWCKFRVSKISCILRPLSQPLVIEGLRCSTQGLRHSTYWLPKFLKVNYLMSGPDE